MPPRVTYWTGAWDPSKEAISKELNALRAGVRQHAPVVAFSPAHATTLSLPDRVLTVAGRRWMLLRAVAALVEPRGDVTHVFGGRGSWHLIRALGRRPLVLTAVVAARPGEMLPPTNFARVVVESEGLGAEWLELGVPRDRIEVVHPGIDLRRHALVPMPIGPRFRLLFASTPADVEEIDPRGIPLLIALARCRPDLDVVVPWRQWGDVAAAKAALAGLDPPTNFVVRHERDEDMDRLFADTHATISCFARGAGKAIPNFVVEGLAVGRPCLTTRENGLAALLERSGAGLVVGRDVDSLAAATDRLRLDVTSRSECARRLAETSFDVREFLRRYERIYDDVARGRTP